MNKRRQHLPLEAKAAVNPTSSNCPATYWCGVLLSVLCVGLYWFYFIAGGTLDPAKRATLNKRGTSAQQTGKNKIDVSQKSHHFHWQNY